MIVFFSRTAGVSHRAAARVVEMILSTSWQVGQLEVRSRQISNHLATRMDLAVPVAAIPSAADVGLEVAISLRPYGRMRFAVAIRDRLMPALRAMTGPSRALPFSRVRAES